MSEAEILFEAKDGIGQLVFNRPAARNAMTFAMYERLEELCRKVDADPSIRVLLLRGAGDKAFVSGTDIAQFRGLTTPAQALAYEAKMDRVLDALEDVRVPTIAVLQGACTGGGAAIAAACDLRIAAPSVKFGFPIARTLGNTLSQRNYARLAALLGVARTRDMLFLARLAEGSELLSAGMLSELTATEEELHPRAEALARRLLEHAPITLRTTKQALNAVLRHGTPPGSPEQVVEAYMSEDFREGVESFLAKRKPQWKGK